MLTATQEEVYTDVRGLIYMEVRRFQLQFGGDWDELLSTANYAFCVALRTYDKQQGQFTTLLVLKLRSFLRRSLRRRLVVELDSNMTPEELLDTRQARWEQVRLWLHSDGLALIDAVLQWDRCECFNSRIIWRLVRREFLEAGWSKSRLTAASDEVRSVLLDVYG